MGKKVLLKTDYQPICTAYNFQMTAGIVISENPSVRNWYLSNCVQIRCERKFLRGYTSPEIMVERSDMYWNPFIEKIALNMRFLKENVHSVIKNMLDEGYYVEFSQVDDYYMKGKSWYREKHFGHDGVICGYDENDHTYTIGAYNSKWNYAIFKVPQKCFEQGMFSMLKKDMYGNITALKVNKDRAELDTELIKNSLKDYLKSDFETYPLIPEGVAFGSVVHDYIGIYLEHLYYGIIPYERKDKRIFRLIWDHKRLMLERIEAVEKKAGVKNDISSEYKNIVEESSRMHTLYIKYWLKKDNGILLELKDRLEKMREAEKKPLEKLILLIEKEDK